MITIENIKAIQEDMGRSVVERARYINPNKKRFPLSFLFERPKYILLKDISLQLRNGNIITIPEGFVWDLSSTPTIFMGIVPTRWRL